MSTPHRPGGGQTSPAPFAHHVDVGDAAQLMASGRAVIEVEGVEVVVLRRRRDLYAFENRCPHLGLPLADEPIRGCAVVCRAHRRRFSLRTGRERGRGQAGSARLRVYDAVIVGGHLLLAVRSTSEHNGVAHA